MLGVLLPAVVLSVVSWRLIDRSAQNEVEERIRSSEAAPWYYQQKMNRALEARAIHTARRIGYDAVAGQAETRAHSDLFEVLEIDRGAAHRPPADASLATGIDSLLALTDDEGRALGPRSAHFQ